VEQPKRNSPLVTKHYLVAVLMPVGSAAGSLALKPDSSRVHALLLLLFRNPHEDV
jgi:hypothetical protein